MEIKDDIDDSVEIKNDKDNSVEIKNDKDNSVESKMAKANEKVEQQNLHGKEAETDSGQVEKIPKEDHEQKQSSNPIPG